MFVCWHRCGGQHQTELPAGSASDASGSEHLDVWGETATHEQKWRADFRSGGVSRFVNTAAETTGARGIGFVGVFEGRIEQLVSLIGQVIRFLLRASSCVLTPPR